MNKKELENKILELQNLFEEWFARVPNYQSAKDTVLDELFQLITPKQSVSEVAGNIGADEATIRRTLKVYVPKTRLEDAVRAVTEDMNDRLRTQVLAQTVLSESQPHNAVIDEKVEMWKHLAIWLSGLYVRNYEHYFKLFVDSKGEKDDFMTFASAQGLEMRSFIDTVSKMKLDTQYIHKLIETLKTNAVDKTPFIDIKKEDIEGGIELDEDRALLHEKNVKGFEKLKSTIVENRTVTKEEEIEQEVKVKLLASINSFLAEQGIKDTDGTPLTFSPERF